MGGPGQRPPWPYNAAGDEDCEARGRHEDSEHTGLVGRRRTGRWRQNRVCDSEVSKPPFYEAYLVERQHPRRRDIWGHPEALNGAFELRRGHWTHSGGNTATVRGREQNTHQGRGGPATFPIVARLYLHQPGLSWAPWSTPGRASPRTRTCSFRLTAACTPSPCQPRRPLPGRRFLPCHDLTGSARTSVIPGAGVRIHRADAGAGYSGGPNGRAGQGGRARERADWRDSQFRAPVVVVNESATIAAIGLVAAPDLLPLDDDVRFDLLTKGRSCDRDRLDQPTNVQSALTHQFDSTGEKEASTDEAHGETTRN